MIYVHSLGRASRYYSARTAVVPAGARITFSELEDRVKGIAAALAVHGFKTGDRLALLLPNSPEYVELVYACSWLGVIAVPLNTRLSAVEIDRVLADAAPRGLIRHSSLPAPTARIPWQKVLDQDPLEIRNDLPPQVVYDPGAVLALIYTSGTTGQPKGVMVTHANVLADIHHFNYWMRYTEGAVYLHAAPLFHIADFPAMFAAPAFGAAQLTIPKFSPQTFCETVERDCVSHTVLVPTMINLLTQYPEIGKLDLHSLKVLAYGGSPMAPELIRRTRELLPNVKLVQVYGLSETGFLTGLQDHEHTHDRLLSCGRPCLGNDLQVTDESGKQVEVGKPGELVVRGANVMRGYWNNPSETALVFRDGWFRTGDVGYQDSEGFFYILDRAKDMIVTGGENVYSTEVENILYQIPQILETAVFGIPDEKWGEAVHAAVVLKEGQQLSEEEIIQFCKMNLARYKAPKSISFLAQLPRTGSGKLFKKGLRDPFWDKYEKKVL
jgi:long-chain acyl-CoA synthetase